jgi:hypothetical protein
MADELTPEKIAENAADPKRVTIDGSTVEQHSIGDQIAADKYRASKAAVKGAKRGLNISKFVPPGTV